jgi:hypothetical protein
METCGQQEKLRLDLRYDKEFFNKYKTCFEGMLN